MGEKKQYRSAIRSRRMIRESFLALLKEKRPEKITVTDIVNRADINRSTFYAHYPDVRGLIEEIENEAVNGPLLLLEDLNDRIFFENPTLFAQSLIKPVIENQELYTLLGRSDYALAHLEKLKTALTEQVIHSPHIPESIRNSDSFVFRIHFFVGGIVHLYQQWLQGNLNCSLDEITDAIVDMIHKLSMEFAEHDSTA